MKRRLVAAAGLIAIITLIARIVGFGRWLVFSGTVGSGCMGTAYGTANILPNVIFEVVAGGALSAAVIPLLMPRIQSRVELSQVASALLSWTIMALVPLTLVLIFCARPLLMFLLDGEDCPGQVAVATDMLMIFAPQLPLYGIGVILGGILQAQGKFVAVAVAPLLSSLLVIGGYLSYAHLAPRQAVGPHWGPSPAALWVLAGSTTAGVVLLSLPLLLPVLRSGVRLRPTLTLDSGTAKRGARLAGGGLLALIAQQLLTVVTVAVANQSGTGVLPVYQYAQAVYLLPYAVLIMPIVTASLPSLLARMSGASSEAVTLLRQSTTAVFLLAALSAAAVVAVAPAVGVLFQDLDNGKENIEQLPSALSGYAPGLVGFALMAHLGRFLAAAAAVGRTAVTLSVGWVIAAGASPFLVSFFESSAPQSSRALLALGISSSVGMMVSGVLLLGQTRALGYRSLGGLAVPGWLLLGRILTIALGASCLGRITTDAAVRLFSDSLSPVFLALVAAILSVLIVLLSFATALAVTDRPELRILLRHVRLRRSVEAS